MNNDTPEDVVYLRPENDRVYGRLRADNERLKSELTLAEREMQRLAAEREAILSAAIDRGESPTWDSNGVKVSRPVWFACGFQAYMTRDEAVAALLAKAGLARIGEDIKL